MLSLRHFGLVLFMPKNLARRRMVSAAAMLLDRLGPPGRCSGCWPHDGEVAGGAVADLGLLISGSRRRPRRSAAAPALTPLSPIPARGVEWASVSADLRGSLATRGVAPKQQGGSGVLSLRHFGLVLFIPWRVGAEESGAA